MLEHPEAAENFPEWWKIIVASIGAMGAVGAALHGLMFGRRERAKRQADDDYDLALNFPKYYLGGPPAEIIRSLKCVEDATRSLGDTMQRIERYLAVVNDAQGRQIKLLDEQASAAREIRDRQMRSLSEMIDAQRVSNDALRSLCDTNREMSEAVSDLAEYLRRGGSKH